METKEQKNIINVLYFLLILSSVLSFVPHSIPQVLSVATLILSLCAAYYYRSRDTQDGLMYNHMTYLIGTIWYGTTFIVIGMILTVLWVYLKGDHTAIYNLTADIQSGMMMSEDDMYAVMQTYMDDNRRLLVLSSIVTIGPGLAYFIYRVVRGYKRAMDGYRIANPKSWL